MWAYMLPGRLDLQIIGFTARRDKDFLNVCIEYEPFLVLITLAWPLPLQLKSFFFPTIPLHTLMFFKKIPMKLSWLSGTAWLPWAGFFPSQPCRATGCFKNRWYLLILTLQRQNESWKAVGETKSEDKQKTGCSQTEPQRMRPWPQLAGWPRGGANLSRESPHVFVQWIDGEGSCTERTRGVPSVDQHCIQLANFTQSLKRATLLIHVTAAKIKYNMHHWMLAQTERSTVSSKICGKDRFCGVFSKNFVKYTTC